MTPLERDHLQRARPAAVREHETLMRAAAVWAPARAGDARFVPDELPTEDRAALAAVCSSCPIRTQCHAYASAA